MLDSGTFLVPIVLHNTFKGDHGASFYTVKDIPKPKLVW